MPPIRRVVYRAIAVTAAPRTPISNGVFTPDALYVLFALHSDVAHGSREGVLRGAIATARSAS